VMNPSGRLLGDGSSLAIDRPIGSIQHAAVVAVGDVAYHCSEKTQFS